MTVKDLAGEYDGIRYQIQDGNSTTATLKIHLKEGQSVRAIPGCMFATSANIEIKGKLKKTLRAIVGPDDARYQLLTAVKGDGWVILAPNFFGSIQAVQVKEGEEVCIGDDAFLATIGDTEYTSKSQGLKKAIFSGHGLFVKSISGKGIVFVCAVGSMQPFDLEDGEEVVVDTGHLVTWPAKMAYDIQRADKSWWSTGMSGEGMVSKLTGPGSISIQTRNGKEVAGWIYDSKIPA